MIERKTWVATFDGSEARVYGFDREGRLHELPGERMTGGHGPHANEGRATLQAEYGGGQDAQGKDPDPENLTEAGFVDLFAKRLETLARQGAFEHLVVAAAPQALGRFRKTVGRELQEKIRVELDKDYVHTPIKDLERTLHGRL
jgi:protein required for attachment to host cells